MGEPFLGEIKLVAFANPIPKGWAECNGQFLPINQNQALFALLGTQYGGNGQTTFALPDLRGRMPRHQGSLTVGVKGGEEAHTVSQPEMPAHNHMVIASNVTATANAPIANGRLANSSPQNLYGPFGALAAMDAGSITNVGGSQPHENMQPSAVTQFLIALQGVFPSQN